MHYGTNMPSTKQCVKILTHSEDLFICWQVDGDIFNSVCCVIPLNINNK